MRFKFALAALVVAPLCVCACDVILGLDKYCGTDCDAGALDAAFDVDATDAADASTDALAIPDVLDEATSWARWRMENPLAEVQAEAGPAVTSLASFADAAAPSVVIDGVTGLTWSTAPSVANTVEDAAVYCATLQPAGFRLPTRIELVSLLDTTRTSSPYIEAPFVQPLIAAKAAGGNLFTSSYVRPIVGNLQFWVVSITSGEVYKSNGNQSGVLCVR